MQGPIEAQPQNRTCRIYEEDGFDQAVLYVEQWASEAHFEQHVRSEVYRRILAAVEFSSKPPEIRFDFVSQSKGMELIEALRTPQNETPQPP